MRQITAVSLHALTARAVLIDISSVRTPLRRAEARIELQQSETTLPVTTPAKQGMVLKSCCPLTSSTA